MFAYILKADKLPDEQTDAFFERFKQTPGLLHAYNLQGMDNPTDAMVVAVWQNREAAQAYLDKSPLRKEVDQTISGVSRTMYKVRNSK
ncbi:MAG TPA: hypothetical protein VIN06_12025 [Devosia sp.]